MDVDGDGIPYRTIPGTHPSKGSFFTRGTSHDEYARYSESGEVYLRKVDRLSQKWDTAKTIIPAPENYQNRYNSKTGIVFFGTTTYAAIEALDILSSENTNYDAMRIKAFPFHKEVVDFIANHDRIFVVEQNKDAQFRTLLINELDTNPSKLIPILNYDGMPITAANITNQIRQKDLIESI